MDISLGGPFIKSVDESSQDHNASDAVTESKKKQRYLTILHSVALVNNMLNINQCFYKKQ